MGKNKKRNSKAAKTLTDNEQNLSVAAFDKSRQRKKVVVNVLDSPLDIQWPQVGNENEKAVISLLENSLVPFRRPSISVRSKELREVPKNERKEWRAARQAGTENSEMKEKRITQNKFLAVGLSKVSRALEKGLAKLVVAERSCDSPLLTRFLIPLCRAKGVPLLPVKQISSTLTTKLQLPRCLCIAFTQGVQNEDNPLKETFEELLAISTQIEPTTISINTESPENCSPVENINKTVDMEVAEEPTERVNYYLKKPLNGKPAFVPGKTNPLKKGASDVTKSEFGTDFLSFGNVPEKNEPEPVQTKKPIFKEMRIKRLQNNVNKPKKLKTNKK